MCNQLENQVFEICVSSTIKWIKENDLIEALKERISITSQLNTTKESTDKIIKYYDISMKAASCTIARTIIEMTIREYRKRLSSFEKTYESVSYWKTAFGKWLIIFSFWLKSLTWSKVQEHVRFRIDFEPILLVSVIGFVDLGCGINQNRLIHGETGIIWISWLIYNIQRNIIFVLTLL